MFTGIIEYLGTAVAVEHSAGGARLTIEAGPVAAGTRVGDSVAVNGVCLTAVAVTPPRLEFEAIPETLRRSNLGTLAAGSRVNLERPLAADGRLSGHFVQGHVDGVGEVAAAVVEGDSLHLTIVPPAALLRYIVEKGSIAVDGVSLTVAACHDRRFQVALIPHTRAATTLGRTAPADAVNLEVDVLAKYVEKLVGERRTTNDEPPS
jgi:riboflavin synthase